MKIRAFAIRLASLILLIAVMTCAISCEGGEAPRNPAPKSRDFDQYFDTESTISDYSGSKSEDFSALCDEIDDMLSYYHKLFDIYNEYEGMTNIATLNRLAGEGEVSVPRELCELLSFSLDMYEKTDGRVNIAMGSVLSLWHEAREASKPKKNYTPVYYIPDMSSLTEAAKHTDPKNIVVNTEKSTVKILDPLLRLDVGAVAKGFTAEKISDYIKSKNLSGYVIDLGMNLRIVGTKPDGSGWMAGIIAPGGGAANPKKLSDSALVTSGVYQRSYEVDGKRYHHIIHPETLMPDDRYWSVSINTESSAVADALSTAFFNMTEAEIEAAVKKFPGTEVTVIYPDGEVLIIGGIVSTKTE